MGRLITKDRILAIIECLVLFNDSLFEPNEEEYQRCLDKIYTFAHLGSGRCCKEDPVRSRNINMFFEAEAELVQANTIHTKNIPDYELWPNPHL